tara:strand:+ start:2212 stop:2385 length:174 start_codon:yes stop_codon:yes gene_type:complete
LLLITAITVDTANAANINRYTSMSNDTCEYGIATDRTTYTTGSGEAVPAVITATGSK